MVTQTYEDASERDYVPASSAADRLRSIKDDSYDQSLKQSSTAHIHLKTLRKSAGCGTRLVIIGIILDPDKLVERGLSVPIFQNILVEIGTIQFPLSDLEKLDELEYNPFQTHSADMRSTHLKLTGTIVFIL